MKRLAQTDVPVVALTHPGMKGKNNEDSFGVSAFSGGIWGARPILLAVLSDGIGGHRAGEVASAIAVEQISRIVQDSDGRNPPETLRKAIHAASVAIRNQAVSNPEQAGMGATCACVWVHGSRLYTASIGDSRLYLLRAGRLRRISTDHTWVQEALERGLIQRDQINGHPNQHVIRRYLGSPALPEVDLRLRLADGESDTAALANQGTRVLPGDLLLLTSDGLTDLVTDEEICAHFLGAPTEQAGRQLIDLANQRGGHDNITIVALQLPLKTRLREPVPWAAAAGALLLVLALGLGLAGAGWWWLRGRAGPLATPTPSAVVQPAATSTSAAVAGQTRAAPTLAPFTATPTRLAELPLEGGATLTPWPTNTPAP
jgi:protein phosphatase